MRRPYFTVFLALFCSFPGVSSVLANDSMVELKTGGLSYVRSDAVTMLSEDLYISMDKIKVDYVFENQTGADVESLVAFPMPDIVPMPYESAAVPGEGENFLGFKVFVEGEQILPAFSQRALAYGVDVTAELQSMNIPLMPYDTATADALAMVPRAVLDDWLSRGLIYDDIYDVGEGMKSHPTALWTLRQVYTWRMNFPAGQKVHVSHTYTPSVGGSAGVIFLDWDGKDSVAYDEYVGKYCIDPPFVNAVRKRVKPDGGIPMNENWISYILTTGLNWNGAIGTFHLTIDKGSTNNLVSFCGTGVKKTGPTTFELTYKDYFPEKELDVLILEPTNW